MDGKPRIKTFSGNDQQLQFETELKKVQDDLNHEVAEAQKKNLGVCFVTFSKVQTA